VATVILGGLISSTLLDFLVHPALFWCFGKRDAEEQLSKGDQDELDDDSFQEKPSTEHADLKRPVDQMAEAHS
jgi:hypothetical protein